MKQASAQESTKRPGIFELGARAWRSALGAAVTMLPLFAIVAAALFVLNYAFPMLETHLRVIRPGRTDIMTLMVVPGAWVFGLEKLALGLAAAAGGQGGLRPAPLDRGDLFGHGIRRSASLRLVVRPAGFLAADPNNPLLSGCSARRSTRPRRC